MKTCDDVRLWAHDADDPEVRPPDVDAHVAACDACRRRLRLARHAAALGAEASRSPVPPVPAFERVAGAVRPRRATALPWLAAGLAAAGIAVAVAAWPEGPDGAPAGPPPGPEPLRAGQVVETAADATVLSDPRTAAVVIAPRTRVRVDAWAPEATELWVEDGRVDLEVRHRAPGQTFRVRTEYVEVAVVGTRFRVEHRHGAGTEVTTLEGEVRVTGADGVVRAVVAGRSVVAGPAGFAGVLATATLPGTASPAADLPEARGPELASVGAPRDLARATGAHLAPLPRPDPEAALATARRRLAEGRPAEAIAALEPLVQPPGPAPSRLLGLLGDAYRAAGRGDDARAAYVRALAAATPADRGPLMVDLASLLQADLHRPAEARQVWSDYLAAWPAGRYAGRALWEMAALADAGGRTDEAVALRRRVVEQAPGGPEAVPALSAVGRGMIERGDLDGAAAWFEGRAGGADDLAEAARVGLMRVRLQQGRETDVCALAAAYGKDFPRGARRDDVGRLARSAGCP